MLRTLVVIVALLAVGFVIAQQEVVVPVQRVAQLRQLSAGEVAQINSYLAARPGLRKSGNYEATREALIFLTQIDQSHFPLTREPKDYLADYQNFTQLLNRVNWYVRVPVIKGEPGQDGHNGCDGRCPAPQYRVCPQPATQAVYDTRGIAWPGQYSEKSRPIAAYTRYDQKGGTCRRTPQCSDFPPSPIVPPPVPPPPGH